MVHIVSLALDFNWTLARISGLQEQRISLLDKLQRFRDQGTTMRNLAGIFYFLVRKSKATRKSEA